MGGWFPLRNKISKCRECVYRNYAHHKQEINKKSIHRIDLIMEEIKRND